MDNLKDIRWKQRFENFNKSYRLLKKYANKMTKEIITLYLPELDKMYDKLSQEL